MHACRNPTNPSKFMSCSRIYCDSNDHNAIQVQRLREEHGRVCNSKTRNHGRSRSDGEGFRGRHCLQNQGVERRKYPATSKQDTILLTVKIYRPRRETPSYRSRRNTRHNGKRTVFSSQTPPRRPKYPSIPSPPPPCAKRFPSSSESWHILT